MNDLVDRLAVAASWRELGDSGDGPPRDDQLGPPDILGIRTTRRRARRLARRSLAGPALKRDGRVPDGWRLTVVGRPGRRAGRLRRRRALAFDPELAQILSAQQELHPELIVMTGLRPGPR